MRCDECNWWQFLDRLPNTIDILEDVGKCRRYPPSIPCEIEQSEDQPQCAGWHWTRGHDWCGEFSQVTPADPTAA